MMANDYDLHPTVTGVTELPELTKHYLLLLVNIGDTVTGQYPQSLEDPGFPGVQCRYCQLFPHSRS